MYYISKETFDALDPELQKRAIDDTKELVGIGEPKEEETEEPPMTPGEKASAKTYEDDMALEEKKNKNKTFDEAGDKGMAVLIGIGKEKPKKPPMKKEEEAEEE